MTTTAEQKRRLLRGGSFSRLRQSMVFNSYIVLVLTLLLHQCSCHSRVVSSQYHLSRFSTTAGGSSYDGLRRQQIRRRRSSSSWLTIRGGSTLTATTGKEEKDDDNNNTHDDDGDDDIRRHPEYDALLKYRMKQQGLLELRSVILNELLAKRGLPFVTLVDVMTPEGKAPPKRIDWDCTISTPDNPIVCMLSQTSEEGTKLIGPIQETPTTTSTDSNSTSKHSTAVDQWVSLNQLVRLRRNDASKVESLWHHQYTILDGWFGPESDYSLLQHVGAKGLVLDFLLTNERFRFVLVLSTIVAVIIFMPVLEYFVTRLLVSGLFWSQWIRWRMLVHAALPLKLLLGQMAFKALAQSFDKVCERIKIQLVQMECELMEELIPLTLGVPTLVPKEEEEVDVEDWNADIDDDGETERKIYEEEDNDDDYDDDEEDLE